jgi:hypothetical protein
MLKAKNHSFEFRFWSLEVNQESNLLAGSL